MKNKEQPSTHMVSLARELYDYKKQIADYESAIKGLREKSEEIEKELVDAIVDTYQETDSSGEPVEMKKGRSFDINDSYKAILVTKTIPRILPGGEEKVHDWIRKEGYPSAIKPYIFPQTMKSIMKEVAEKRDCDIKDIVNTELIDCMDAYVDRSVTFRKKG